MAKAPKVTKSSGEALYQADPKSTKNSIKRKFPAGHPLRNKVQHHRLLSHINDRLDEAKVKRASRVNRFAIIDRAIAGFLVLDREDEKRRKENEEGKAPKPTKTRLHILQAQLDESVTFLLNVFAPEEGMFSAVADKETQSTAQGVSLLMEKHGKHSHYYQSYHRFFQNALRYNIGILITYWDEEVGSTIKNDASRGAQVKKNQTVWTGNKMESVDPYNFMCDPNVEPTKLAAEGEWFSKVDEITKFRARKMEQLGQLYNVDAVITDQIPTTSWYMGKPNIRGTDGDAHGTDWMSVLSAGRTSGTTKQTNLEILDWYGWLDGADFGLSTVPGMQIYRVTLLQGHTIANTVELTNAHGQLPIGVTMPIDDELVEQQKSYGEMLAPLNDYASFLINTAMDGTRRSLYGLLFYNPDMVNLDRATGDVVSGRIPVKNLPEKGRIQDNVMMINDSPQTGSAVPEIAQIKEIMQIVLPTEMLRQVTDLDRATMYQAAATVQAANRRQQKMARLIDDQAMSNVRFQMYYNILQFQESITIMADNGEKVEIDPGQLRDSDIEFSIADGLKGMDRLMFSQLMSDLINKLLQSPQAAEQIDLVALLNYWTSLFGENMDLNQFKMTPERIQEVAEISAVRQAAAAGLGGAPGAPAGAAPGTQVPA